MRARRSSRTSRRWGGRTSRSSKFRASTRSALRHASMDLATGDVLCQWDDDDLHHPQRVARQPGADTAPARYRREQGRDRASSLRRSNSASPHERAALQRACVRASRRVPGIGVTAGCFQALADDDPVAIDEVTCGACMHADVGRAATGAPQHSPRIGQAKSRRPAEQPRQAFAHHPIVDGAEEVVAPRFVAPEERYSRR